MKFRVGSTVRLKGGKRTARIVRFYSDIRGGVVLNRKLAGFYSWNTQDLEVVPAKKERAK